MARKPRQATKIVYRDQFQVVAEPGNRRFRS